MRDYDMNKRDDDTNKLDFTAPGIGTAPGTAAEPLMLRDATPEDAAALALVGAATFLEAFTWMLPGADIVAHCARHHTAEAYAGYLARPATAITLAVTRGGAPVGYAMLATPELPSFDVQPGDTELKRIYLFSRFRSSPVDGAPGVRPGQALLASALARAAAQGRTRVLLGTHDSNQRAIGFYERNGFKCVGTRQFVVGGSTCSDLIFGKFLEMGRHP